MPKLWGVNQCLLDPRPELESGTPQASSFGSCAPKIRVHLAVCHQALMVYAEFPDVSVLPGRNQETGVGLNLTMLG